VTDAVQFHVKHSAVSLVTGERSQPGSLRIAGGNPKADLLGFHNPLSGGAQAALRARAAKAAGAAAAKARAEGDGGEAAEAAAKAAAAALGPAPRLSIRYSLRGMVYEAEYGDLQTVELPPANVPHTRVGDARFVR
jgi:hypothetical protein